MKVYYVNHDQRFRALKRNLEKHGLEYELRLVSRKKPLTEKEFKDILKFTDNGIDDVLAKRSSVYKEISQVLNFNDLKLSQVLRFINNNPNLLKSPITVFDHKVIFGFKNEDSGSFLQRNQRKEKLFMLMKSVS